MRLIDKVAVVTGAGRGIGAAIALRFAEEGAQLVVNDINDSDARRTVEAITNIGGRAIAVIGSVTAREVAQEMVDGACREFAACA